jgi:hypothetical protein
MAERGILEQAYGQLIPQGMRPNYAAPRTSVEPTSMVGRGEIRPYNFSWRDMARQWLGSIGMSDNTANAVITLADFTPVGAAFVGNEARRAVGRGERLAPAADVALAAAPLPMAAKRATSKVVREVAQEVPTITAYHGSPHPQFDRFDMSKVGTGEGAQAQGYGLYFAEKEAVAQGYRDKLSRKDWDWNNPEDVAQYWLLNYNGDREATANYLRAASKANKQDPTANDALKIIESGKSLDQASNKAGSMYQVQINADPADFLDFDAPLSGQPKAMQALRNIDLGVMPEGNRTRVMLERALQGTEQPDYPATGKTLSVGLDAAFGTNSPQASAFLAEQGLKGVKYLDEGSRAAGEGSRNFVVFDDKLINILKRYSWVPGMAIPAAAIQEYTTMYGVAPDLGGQPPSVTVY